MFENTQPPWDPGNQYGLHNELSCITPSLSVDHTNERVLLPDELSLADELILHALGVTWRAQTVAPKRRRVLRTPRQWLGRDENLG
jgi:hypothetical protein